MTTYAAATEALASSASPSSRKRDLEDGGEDERRNVQKKVRMDREEEKSSGRRALKTALARYERVSSRALAAMQRAQVLLRRVENERLSISEDLASLPARAPRESKFERRTSGFNPALAEAMARATAVAAAAKAATAANPSLLQQEKPTELRVDAMGREIDASGLPTSMNAEEKDAKKKKANPYSLFRSVDASDALQVVDPRLMTRKRRESKKTRAFSFVKEGHYAKVGAAARAKASGVEIDVIEEDVPRRPEHVASIPGMEWWDEEFLSREAREKRTASISERMRDGYDACNVENSRFHGLVHHPAATKPLAASIKQPETMPFYLTKRDRKRIRRQTRAERERERQDKVQLGLIPPPEPKFKLSNFMKVLGEQAVANPSKMEQKVMEHVNQRLQHHEMRNAARKLTPQERKEKKRRKLAEDTSNQVTVAVFYVRNLDSAQHKFKLNINAQQLNLTGGVIICSSPEASFALVVVEGGPKGIRKFVALVTRRISWGQSDLHQSLHVRHDGNSADDNWAAHIWQGTVTKRAFSQFKFQECSAATSARRLLETKGVPHYWDMAQQRHDLGQGRKSIQDEGNGEAVAVGSDDGGKNLDD